MKTLPPNSFFFLRKKRVSDEGLASAGSWGLRAQGPWREGERTRLPLGMLERSVVGRSHGPQPLLGLNKPPRAGSLLGTPLTRLYAGDQDVLPLTPQGAGLTLRHRPLLAVHLHADADALLLALRGLSADTFAALVCKDK